MVDILTSKHNFPRDLSEHPHAISSNARGQEQIPEELLGFSDTTSHENSELNDFDKADFDQNPGGKANLTFRAMIGQFIALSGLLLLLVALYFLFFSGKDGAYEATAIVSLEPEWLHEQARTHYGDDQNASRSQERIDHEAELIASPPILIQALDRLGETNTSLSYRKLKQNLTVTKDGPAYLILVRSDEAQKAANLANAIAESYLLYRNEQSIAQPSRDLSHLKHKLSLLQKEICDKKALLTGASSCQIQPISAFGHPNRPSRPNRLPIIMSGNMNNGQLNGTPQILADLAQDFVTYQSEANGLSLQDHESNSTLAHARQEQRRIGHLISNEVLKLRPARSITPDIHVPTNGPEQPAEPDTQMITGSLTHSVNDKSISAAGPAKILSRAVSNVSSDTGSYSDWFVLSVLSLVIGVFILFVRKFSWRNEAESCKLDDLQMRPSEEQAWDGLDETIASKQDLSYPTNDQENNQENEDEATKQFLNPLATLPRLFYPLSDHDRQTSFAMAADRVVTAFLDPDQSAWEDEVLWHYQEAVDALLSKISTERNAQVNKTLLLSSFAPNPDQSLSALALALCAKQAGQSILLIDASENQYLTDFMQPPSKPDAYLSANMFRDKETQLVCLPLQLGPKHPLGALDVSSSQQDELDWIIDQFDLVVIDAPSLTRLKPSDGLLSISDTLLLPIDHTTWPAEDAAAMEETLCSVASGIQLACFEIADNPLPMTEAEPDIPLQLAG